MPELPEVETIRRQLAQRIPGRTIVRAGSHPSPSYQFASTTVGSTILHVQRRGKYLLFPLADDRELVIHLGMTGVVRVEDRATVFRGDSHERRWIRAWWEFDDGTTLTLSDVRRFGKVAVVRRGQYRSLPTLAKMGPEPLGSDFNTEPFHAALSASSSPIKSQLLSQRPVAGIGNIYADEALWRSQINPITRQISRARAQHLHDAIVAVLSDAIDHGGTRLRDYRSVDGDTGQHQYHLDCYGRQGKPCNRCGTSLRHRMIQNRGTTWCPKCQAR